MLARAFPFLGALLALCFASLAVAQFTPPGFPPGAFQNRAPLDPSPGGGGSCSQSTAFLARLSGSDTAHKNAVDALICGEVTDGIFALADIQYLLCQDTAANAALNLQSTSFTLTVNGSPTFTANSGYVGGSTANIDTGFNPSTAGGNLSQNSVSIFVWSLTNFSAGTAYGVALGQNIAAPTLDLYPHFSDNNFYAQVSGTVGDNVLGTGHFYGATRGNATTDTLYVDTTGTGGTSKPSVALSNTDVLLLNDGFGGNNSRPFVGNLAYAWAGANLTGPQQSSLQGRVHTYMQTICGAP